MSAVMPLAKGRDHYESNVYYHPEFHGLTTVAEIDYSDGDYQFDLRVVWADGEGRLWTARDSGCSCPSPFESCTELDRLFSMTELVDEYREAVTKDYGFKPDAPTWQAFRDEVAMAFQRLSKRTA